MRGRGVARPRRPSRVPYALGAIFCVLWIGLVCAALFFGGSSEEAKSSGAHAASPSKAASEKRPSMSAKATSGPPADDYAEAGDQGAYTDVSSDVQTNQNRAGAGTQGRRPPAGTRLPQGAGGRVPYDPLGTGAGSGTLSETDRDRARLAAFKFVDAAYDFEGSGPEARASYVADIDRTVDSSEFWDSPGSPGADALKTTARRIKEYGAHNSGALQDFRIEDESSERVVGSAIFVLDEGSGERTYQQQFVLRRWAAVWRVLYARQIEEVS